MLRRLILVTAILTVGWLAPTAWGQEAPPTTAPPTTAAAAPTTVPPPTTVAESAAPEAHGNATLVLTQSEGLVDGQTVGLAGSGYPANMGEWGLWICPVGASAMSASIDLVASCGSAEEITASTDGAGNLSGSFVAQRVVEQQNRGFTELDCGVSGCEVFMVGGNHLYFEAATVITFADVIAASPGFTG